MKRNLVTLTEIKELLKSWSDNKNTTMTVWDWANERYFPGETDFDDWNGDKSAANEVLCELDNLDMNLVLPEDIPIHIEFLNTPIGKFDEGYHKWRSRIEKINFKQRCRSLIGH